MHAGVGTESLSAPSRGPRWAAGGWSSPYSVCVCVCVFMSGSCWNFLLVLELNPLSEKYKYNIYRTLHVRYVAQAFFSPW